jgi:Family of unknown function (DUF6112)
MAVPAVLAGAISVLAREEEQPVGVWTPGPVVQPNVDGLPGLLVLKQIVGALLTWGLVACVGGLAVSVMVWIWGRFHGNYGYTSTGKLGVLVAAGGALLIGAANGIVAFFSALGSRIG